jgi:dihydroorotase
VEKFSVNPRRLLGLPAIAVKEGTMANLTIFDPAAQWVVNPEAFRSKSRNTPFRGMTLTGKPIGILNNGETFWN